MDLRFEKFTMYDFRADRERLTPEFFELNNDERRPDRQVNRTSSIFQIVHLLKFINLLK